MSSSLILFVQYSFKRIHNIKKQNKNLAHMFITRFSSNFLHSLKKLTEIVLCLLHNDFKRQDSCWNWYNVRVYGFYGF